MKDSLLFYVNNKKIKIKSINSNLKQIPTTFKANFISIKSLPLSKRIPGSKSFRQQKHYLTMKNSKEKNKKVNILENTSLENNSQFENSKKIKNKNIITNSKTSLNYNTSLANSNILNYKEPATNINNNITNKPNMVNTQKEEENTQYYRISTVIQPINSYFSQSANNSIYNNNKNKQNSKNNQSFKMISCLNGWIRGTKGILKVYNTANNTANNSICESSEKKIIIESDNKKNKKSNKKNIRKSIKTKDIIKKINNDIENNLLNQFKNKISQTAKNSRKNSGDKYIEINKSKFVFNHDKLKTNNIREFNINNNKNNHGTKNKPLSTQVTIDTKKINIKKNKNIESKPILTKSNNNCQTKNHILRKNNQDNMKLYNTNIKEKIKVSSTKLNTEKSCLKENSLNINNILNLNNNTNSNSAFTTFFTGQNLKLEKSQIKVNKSNKIINNSNTDNNVIKGILYHPKYKNKNLKNIGMYNVNEKSVDIIKNKGVFPTSYFFNKLNKKILTARNSPGHSKFKELIGKDINKEIKKSKNKISYKNAKQILSKEVIKKSNKSKVPNLKSAYITRKNSKNKDFKVYKNIMSEYKLNKNYDLYYNDSNPNNYLRSINSLNKENNKNMLTGDFKINCNSKNNTNCKNSQKLFKSIINIGNNFEYMENQQFQNNKIFSNFNDFEKKLNIKNKSTNNSKLKLKNKSNNINNSPNPKTKNNHLCVKKVIDIFDNNTHKKNNLEQLKNNLNGEKSGESNKRKKKIKKCQNQKIINSENNNKGVINNGIYNLSKKIKNINSGNIINKLKLEQLLVKKEINNLNKINKEFNLPILHNDEDVLNSNRNNHENSSRSKMAKKSAHNRNVEQNPIFNNKTNTSILSTMKDSNYYSQESENLSKYIKDYFQSHSSYPPTDISFYKFGRMIGRGAFGKVNIGLNILTGRIVAIKSFNKQNLLNEKAKKKILYETNLMRGLYHPSVTKILETFETDKYMLIIMEYISGGNLQNFVKKRRKLCEKTARILYRQLIQGIKYIHSKGIVHRDIKLENILLDLNNIVKICDFGVGKLTQKGQKLSDQCGTPVYMAPEIIKGDGYEGFPVDVWSSGIALYIMLSGNIPFNRDKIHDLQSAILNLPYKKIDDISDNANNLLEHILEKDPNKRYTPDDILEHPWMNENSGNNNEGSDYDLEIKNVNKYHLFTNAESILLAKTHIDYRKAPKKDLAENFTIKNLYTLEDKKNNNNIETKSIILAPYNSMLTDTDEEEEEEDDDDDENIINKKNQKEKLKNKIEKEEDIKIKAFNYYNRSTNPNDILDNFNFEIKTKNNIIKFHGKVKEFNMNYELNNNEEIDNGMLVNSKDELVVNNKEKDQLENYIKNTSYINQESNKNKKSHRPNSPYKQPPLNPYFLKMVANLGYSEEYVIKSLEKNELNHATTIYYLFSNYENIK